MPTTESPTSQVCASSAATPPALEHLSSSSNSNSYLPSTASAAPLNDGHDPYAYAAASSAARSTYGNTNRGSGTNKCKRTLGLVAPATRAKRVVGWDKVYDVHLGGRFVLEHGLHFSSFTFVLSSPPAIHRSFRALIIPFSLAQLAPHAPPALVISPTQPLLGDARIGASRDVGLRDVWLFHAMYDVLRARRPPEPACTYSGMGRATDRAACRRLLTARRLDTLHRLMRRYPPTISVPPVYPTHWRRGGQPSGHRTHTSRAHCMLRRMATVGRIAWLAYVPPLVSPALSQAYSDALDEWGLPEAMRADMALEEVMEKRYDEIIASAVFLLRFLGSFTLGCSLDFMRFCFCAISARGARAGMLDVVLFSRRRD
ncbi:hypothetical protein C8J57DRAFT_1724097 [Mycena rebaudengoi]|nr:hypothetical protein C8J57DRAFT_1724097 [Mycena rebaudengoi]